MSDQNSSEKNEKQDQQAEQAQAPQPQQFQGQAPQPPQYQQFQGQQYQQPQQGQFAPSAHSAPQMAYGYAAQPQQPSGFATMFSWNFASKGGRSLAKIVMMLAIVAFGIFGVYQLFSLIEVMTADYSSGMQITTGIFHFVYAMAKALVVLGGIRLLLERVPAEDNSAN